MYRLLNEELITKAESFPNVKIHFNHKFVSCDFDAGKIDFEVSADVGLLGGENEWLHGGLHGGQQAKR